MGERIKHSGPDTKFCVLCNSGEHERVDDESPTAVCPNCGPTSPEPHPRLPVQRCSNCKERLWISQTTGCQTPNYTDGPCHCAFHDPAAHPVAVDSISTHGLGLRATYEAPAADVGPTSPRSELQAAAQTLRRHGGYVEGELSLWLTTTADIHGPDETGQRCDRDGDPWPCFDVQAAQKAAFAIGYRPPEQRKETPHR